MAKCGVCEWWWQEHLSSLVCNFVKTCCNCAVYLENRIEGLQIEFIRCHSGRATRWSSTACRPSCTHRRNLEDGTCIRGTFCSSPSTISNRMRHPGHFRADCRRRNLQMWHPCGRVLNPFRCFALHSNTLSCRDSSRYHLPTIPQILSWIQRVFSSDPPRAKRRLPFWDNHSLATLEHHQQCEWETFVPLFSPRITWWSSTKTGKCHVSLNAHASSWTRSTNWKQASWTKMRGNMHSTIYPIVSSQTLPALRTRTTTTMTKKKKNVPLELQAPCGRRIINLCHGLTQKARGLFYIDISLKTMTHISRTYPLLQDMWRFVCAFRVQSLTNVPIAHTGARGLS